MTVRTAVVGLGWWGREHVKSVAGSTKMEIVHLVDPDLETAKPFAEELGLSVSAEYEDVLADDRINAVILATPEYHGSFCAMTKLIIENLGFPSVLAGKPMALVGVAAGRIGAIKSLEQLKGICSHVGAIVVPGAVSIAGVRGAFAEDGRCTDPGAEQALRSVAGSLLGFIKDYVCPKFALEDMVRGEARPWTGS